MPTYIGYQPINIASTLVAKSFSPTDLGKGDGSNFFCKRLPFGFCKDQRRVPHLAINGTVTISGPVTIAVIEYLDQLFDVTYDPGRVDTYSTAWELSVSCGEKNPATRTPGTKKSSLSFGGPAIGSTSRPSPFQNAGNIASFVASCQTTFFAESCVDIFSQPHPLVGTREQGRWMFCGAEDQEVGQITYPPLPNIGQSQYVGDCEYMPNIDGAKYF